MNREIPDSPRGTEGSQSIDAVGHRKRRSPAILAALCCPLLLAVSAQPVEAQRAFTDHFTFFWTDSFQNNPTSVENPLDLPPDTVTVIGIGNDPVPGYVTKLANWLEWAYGCYDDDGFQLPADTNIRIGRPVAPAITPNADWIHFHRDHIVSAAIPGTAAHELAHIVQLQYWKVYNTDFPVFVEGMAVAMENTIVPESSRHETFCQRANHRHEMEGNQGLTWPHAFFDIPGTPPELYNHAYCTGIIWTYLMEHNSDGTSPRCPGTDFLRRFLEATDVGGGLGPPSEQTLFDELDALLDDEGTTLDAEMQDFAFANLIRLYHNLDGDQAYGYWWDDNWFNAGDATWGISGMDSLPEYWEYRVLNLDDEFAEAQLDDGYQGEYVHPAGFEDEIADEYGATYWQYRGNLRDLIEDGLDYSGPGLPHSVLVEIAHVSDAEPAHLVATGFRDATGIFHESGSIRFNDVRVEAAGVAVTANGYSDYEFRHTVTAYEWTSNPSWGPLGGLASEHTYRLPLAEHEVLLRGIANAFDYHQGDTLSIIAYATNTDLDVEPSEFLVSPPSFNYADELLFQMNLRKLDEDGYYQNHTATLLDPADTDAFTNYYVQEAAGDGLYRLDLRQDPDMAEDTGLLLTVFPFDIHAAALPDLLVRDYAFELDENGRLTGTVAILNQGTAAVSNARIPIFIEAYEWQLAHPAMRGGETPAELPLVSVIESVLYDDPRVSLAAGETEVITIDYDTGWSSEDEEEARPGHGYLEVTVEIGVNSLAGADGPQIPPPEELTRNNNGPERVSVHCFYWPDDNPLDDAMLAELAPWFEDETEQVVTLWEGDPSIDNLPPQLRRNIIERAQGLRVFEHVRPWRVSPGPRIPPTVFDAFRQVASWVAMIGSAGDIPPLARSLCRMHSLSELYSIAGSFEDDDVNVLKLPWTRLASCGGVQSSYVRLDAVEEVAGFTIGLSWEPMEPLEVVEILPGPDVPDSIQFFVARVETAAVGPGKALVGLALTPGVTLGPQEDLRVLELRLRVRQDAPVEGGIDLCFADGVGQPPQNTSLAVMRGENVVTDTPRRICGRVTVDGAPCFLRADANDDARLDLSDGVFTLDYLYAAGPPPACFDAADANDDDAVDISDAVFTFAYLFLGGPEPPPPFPSCGPDSTPSRGGSCEQDLRSCP